MKNNSSTNTGCLFTFYTLTPLHAGAGESAGSVDLPIQREKHTEYPVVYSSGIKGGLRYFFKNNLRENNALVELIFGKEGDESGSGKVIFTDAKILLFPVRSSEGVFKWVTCPFIIERIKNDLKFIGVENNINKITISGHDEGISSKSNGKTIVLEDFPLTIKSSPPPDVYNLIKNLTSQHFDEETLNDRLIIVSDDVFKILVTNATQIIARNELDKDKISKNLWYEETVPPDSLFYLITIPVPGNDKPVNENDKPINKFKDNIGNKMLQIGGNETIGYGLVRMSNDLSNNVKEVKND
ncbi:MAG: type III-B CRISPR module RAMP protein Cmr4 [Candidatus Altiarchaeales archaeon WOR_SM1_79]|nr:MAG: type III-B CRISPR module RAMP protein Cmr4 [Candidatus Altiarchaeales archaeon WOR_SM1_79]